MRTFMGAIIIILLIVILFIMNDIYLQIDQLKGVKGQLNSIQMQLQTFECVIYKKSPNIKLKEKT